MTLLDFKSVSMSGALSYGRVRVLWRDSVLKAYDKKGKVLEIIASEPVKRPGHIRTWDFETAAGKVTLRGKCMTCGGKTWWGVLWQPGEKLWHAA